jgi:hypothetical protein
MVLVLGYAFTLLSDGYRVLSVGRWIMGFGITPSEKARTIGSARFLDGQRIPNKYFCTKIYARIAITLHLFIGQPVNC